MQIRKNNLRRSLRRSFRLSLSLCILFLTFLSGCTPKKESFPLIEPTVAPPLPTSTPYSSRPKYKPGELVDYTVQDGDTIAALAKRFNTSEAEIFEANPIIPRDVTTLPPGMPMKIPIYYLPLWGSQYHILPDSAFVNGPAAIGFDTRSFVDAYPGWLKDYTEYAGEENRSGAEIVDYVAANFSVNPRLLLALLEYQAHALTDPEMPESPYTLGYIEPKLHSGMYLQLIWAANTLNNGYYGWRKGDLLSFDRTDGRLERPDPWQNAATVGIQYYFSRTQAGAAYERAIGAAGLSETYIRLFGDPWQNADILIPGSLEQPPLLLPFPRAETWTYTGAPHTAWGQGEPFAAVDFAPPSEESGCFLTDSKHFTAAMADGTVARVDRGVLMLDLDMDGDERTGWVIFYLHIAAHDRVPPGTIVQAGDPLGYPSCEGGKTTGTHIHIARKYNGEWILADSPLPFNMEGWLPKNGKRAYEGTLVKNGYVITASSVSDASSRVTSGN